MKRPVRLAPGQKRVLTANRLLDGRTVWRGADGGWNLRIATAAALEDDEADTALEQANAAAQRDGVVGVYEVVVDDSDPPAPVTIRERIRAQGPTVHPDLAKEIALGGAS